MNQCVIRVTPILFIYSAHMYVKDKGYASVLEEDTSVLIL